MNPAEQPGDPVSPLRSAGILNADDDPASLW